MYQVGKRVLTLSHGMGNPSFLIFLHEVYLFSIRSHLVGIYGVFRHLLGVVMDLHDDDE